MYLMCKKCGINHELYYYEVANHAIHLAYSCSYGSKKGKLIRWYLPLKLGLDIKTVKSPKLIRREQQNLFDK